MVVNPTTILLPVVSNKGPEKAQGVYRIVDIDTGYMDNKAYGVLAGYLASIWSKLHHPSFPEAENVKILQNQTGEDLFDCSQRMPNFTISRVEISISDYPAGDDLVFGKTDQIYAGVGAFFMSDASNYALDWFPVEPLRTTMPMLQGNFLIQAPLGEPQVPPQLDKTIGINRGALSGTDVLLPVPYVQPTLQFFGTISLGGDTHPKTPQPATKLASSVSNVVRSMYPIQWINFKKSVLVPQNVKANGFWWRLKPGVVADIAIYGFEKAPGVEMGSLEFGHFEFNPNAGERLP